ncbi:unnamed protein product [Adineta steineri]|uniref:Ankyrin repeat protein n=1 Tax=Adineta steineri TaxID=433720 RepID=A0A815U9Q7_9BILA|nr:unnamed protein product [Adineta steineri]CAF1517854.1 unnamed protein product [Adineta steineri]
MIRWNDPVELSAALNRMSYIRLALQVVEEHNEGKVSILMLAAFYRRTNVVHKLLSWDSSPGQVELRGNVYDIHGDLRNDVTALWCALDRGYFELASILIDNGKANIFYGVHNLAWDYFIETDRLDVLQYLDGKGYVTTKTPGTTNSSYNYYLDLAASLGHTNIVIYFLSKGNEKDIRSGVCVSSALHRAAENGHYECVRVLCSAGLCPKTEDSNGKTILRLAVENNHLHIVDFLLEYNNDEATFNELELLAASYMVSISLWDEDEQSARMRNLLQHSLIKRLLLNIPKEVAQPIAAYEFQTECQSIDEFDQIQQNNIDRLYIEALLIRERILLPKNDETLFPPLVQRGTILVEQDEFDQCYQLWLHTFHLYQRMELNNDHQNFVWLFCQMLAAGTFIPVDQFLEVVHLITYSPQKQLTCEYLATAVCLVAIAAKVT